MDTRSAVLILVLACALFAGSAVADPTLDSEFAVQEQALRAADEADVDVFAPRAFAAARSGLANARSMLSTGREARGREHLVAVAERLAAAARHAEGVRRSMAPLIDARARALAVDAQVRDEAAWVRAQEAYDDVIERAESTGVVDPSTPAYTRALTLFDEAELMAIKVSLLATADALITRARADGVDELAPSTFADAVGLRNRAERALARDRVNRDDARRLADMAMQQARHARSVAALVARIERGEQGSLEAVLLAMEKQLQGVGHELQLDLVLANGLEPAFAQLAAKAREVAAERTAAQRSLEARDRLIAEHLQTIRALTMRTEELEARVYASERPAIAATGAPSVRLGAAPDPRAAPVALPGAPPSPAANTMGLAATVSAGPAIVPAVTAGASDPLVSLAAQFANDEARAFANGQDIVVSLVGLRFVDGSQALDPASLPLLRKLREALTHWPDAPLQLFSYRAGDAPDAKAASEARAAALRDFLRTSAGVDGDRLSVVQVLDPTADAAATSIRPVDLVLKAVLAR